MSKEFDWDQFEKVAPKSGFDWNQFEAVENGSSGVPVPPSKGSLMPGWLQALESFNKGPVTQGFKTGIERTTYGILQSLFPQNQAIKDNMAQQEQAYAKSYEQEPIAALLGNILGGVGSTLPLSLAGEGVALEASPALISRLGQTFGPIAANALGAGLEGGLFGGSQYVNEGESRAGNALLNSLLGGGLSAGLGTLGAAGSAVTNRFIPSAEYIASKASPSLPTAELLARQRAAQGTATPIGDIIGSAELKKKFENKLVPGLGSGGPEKLATLEKQIINKTENVLDKIGSKYVQKDTNELTKELLTKAFDAQKKAKNNLYESVNELAQKEGFNLNLPSFSKKAAESIDALDASLVAKADPKLRNVLKKIRDVEAGIIKNPEVSLKDAQILSSQLSADAAKFASSSATSDRYMAGLFDDLAGSLRKDIKNEVFSRGSSRLQDALNGANANYKENFSGFLDKDVYKLLQQNKDADAIVREIVKPSKTHDKSTRINKIQKLLPKEDKNLMGYSLIEKAIGENGTLDPRKVNNLLNSLGDRQFKALFPDTIVRNELKDLQKLYSLNPEALNRMYNPKTGARNVENLNILKDIAGAFGAGQLGGAATGIATLGGKVLGNRTSVNRFTDEAFRAEVVNEILKKVAKTPEGFSPLKGEINKAIQIWLNDNRRED